MKFRFYLAVIIAKILYLTLKITRLSSGTAIIGLITLKICPEFLVFADKYFVKSKINVTGTNGKTTTSGLISHLIKQENCSLITNAKGANMLNGIVNALAVQINPFKKFDYSVIETDEAFVAKVFDKMDSNYLIVTNLFEDQTDRFSSPIVTRDIIQKGINLRPDVLLVLNADEPISSTLSSKNPAIYYGFNNVYDEEGNLVEYEKRDFVCPICGNKLEYSKNFYSQQGHYYCSCNYSRPQPRYQADVKLYSDSVEINLDNVIYNIPLVGLFNAYNALAAIVLAKELKLEGLVENVKSFKVAFGRSERRNLYGHDTLIQLIKNPAGTNEVLRTVDLSSNILIAANNNVADGTDISWIEQANFEILAGNNKEVVVTGLCTNEVAERLKKAGVKNIKTISSIAEAIEYIGTNADNNITVLTTYTALLTIDKIKEMKKCY